MTYIDRTAMTFPSPSDASPPLTQRSPHGEIVTANIQEIERLIQLAWSKRADCEHVKRAGKETRVRYEQQLAPIQAYLDYLDGAEQRQQALVGMMWRRGQYGMQNAVDPVDIKIIQGRVAKLKSLIAGIDEEARAADAQIALLDADVKLLSQIRGMTTQGHIAEEAVRAHASH